MEESELLKIAEALGRSVGEYSRKLWVEAGGKLDEWPKPGPFYINGERVGEKDRD